MVIVDDSSSSKKVLRNFDMYLADLIYKERSFFIPYELRRVRLRNVGVFDSFEAEFKDFNVVYGSRGTGKTTLVKSIAHVLDLDSYPDEELLKKGEFYGDIEVELIKSLLAYSVLRKSMKDSGYKVYNEYIPIDDDIDGFWRVEDLYALEDLPNYLESILLDDAGDCLTRQQYIRFLEYLKKEMDEEGLQVILTVRVSDDRPRSMFLRMFPDCNFIDLNHLKFQKRLF